jgi:hypothetical protein
MVETLGSFWAKRYEVEIMNVALFSVKSVPKEMSIAGSKSFVFLIELCSKLYGEPQKKPNNADIPITFDLLSIWKRKEESKSQNPSSTDEKVTAAPAVACPCDDVLHMLITEMASTKHLTRQVSSRYVVIHHFSSLTLLFVVI